MEQKKRSLTIGLSILNSLEHVLKPSERRCITTNPEEFNTSKRTKLSLLLSVPDVLENRSKWGHTYRNTFTIVDYTSSNINGNLPIPAPIKMATSESKTYSAGAP